MRPRSFRNNPVGKKWGACGLGNRDTPPLKTVRLRSWIWRRKSRPIPDGLRQESGYAMARRVPAVERPRKSAFGCTTADAGNSGWSSSGTSRWRCPGSCGGGASAAASGSRTTRPFALPRKRFVQAPVLEKAGEYLGTEHSYRRTVKDKGMPIMYDNRKPAKGRQPVGLAPSTVWRWLSWLGGMPGTLRATGS